MDKCQRCDTVMTGAHPARRFCVPCVKAKNSEHVKEWRVKKKASLMVAG